MKYIVLVVLATFVACATPQQRETVTAGIIIETQQSRSKIIEAIVSTLTEDGFSIEHINEKYGLVDCRPRKMLTRELLEKIKEPGRSFMSTSLGISHTVNVSASVSKDGQARLKVSAIAPNGNLDVTRSLGLQKYYSDEIKAKLD